MSVCLSELTLSQEVDFDRSRLSQKLVVYLALIGERVLRLCLIQPERFLFLQTNIEILFNSYGDTQVWEGSRFKNNKTKKIFFVISNSNNKSHYSSCVWIKTMMFYFQFISSLLFSVWLKTWNKKFKHKRNLGLAGNLM